MNFFWNYLCCLWLGSEELDLLPEKPAICDSVDPFIVCSFEVLNSSLVDYQDLSQGWDWHGCSWWNCVQRKWGISLFEIAFSWTWLKDCTTEFDESLQQFEVILACFKALRDCHWAFICMGQIELTNAYCFFSGSWCLFPLLSLEMCFKFDCVLPHLIGYGFTFFTLIFSGIFVVGHTDVWRWKQGKQQMRNCAVCTLRIMLNWWKQWAARAMVSIGAKHWQVVMIQSSSTTVPPSQPFWLLDQSLRLWSTLVFFDLSCIAFHIY